MEGEQVNEEEETKSEKKIRRRTTSLYKAIREQMEFYFSDSNLLRDKFLKQTIERNQDGYVDVEIFLKFNKIRALTDKARDIAKAVSSSDIIEVSEDKTKMRRKLPVVERENIDDCTIYIERLPSDVDHDWLKAVFSSFGTVLYISLPRFKQTGKPKGFSFIEFETPEMAQNACQYFRYDELDRHNMYDIVSDIECGEIQPHQLEEQKVATKKRKREKTEDEQNKRQKSDAETENIQHQDSSKTDETSTKPKKHKKKKHRKRDKHKKKPKNEIEIENLTLRVMSKKEWKSWKNKYLSLQKKVMTEVKQTLLLSNHPSGNSNNSVPDEVMKVPDKSKQQNKNQIEFQPGIIIKINSETPISQVSEFKEKVRLLGDVAYVDVGKEQTTAYIRCSNTESANKILENTAAIDIGEMHLLKGAEEAAYWNKIQTDKEKKHSKTSKQKKRGRNKVITKVEKMMQNKHIRFDD